MTDNPVPARLPRLRVNLAIVRGHYADAARRHTPGRARGALFAALRDIPALIDEIERLWELTCDTQVRYANLRAAALATMTAYDTGDPDPLSYVRDALTTSGCRFQGSAQHLGKSRRFSMS